MKDRRCVLFAGKASERLAKSVTARHDAINRGAIYHHQFPSGEWYCQLKENVRGADVFLMQAVSQPANDNLMQLLIMADAARRASADRITAVIPYLGYSRQDRKDKPRVPISAKLVLDIIAAAGINRVITMDLHAQQVQGFTNLPLDHLYFQPTLSAALKKYSIDVVVAPDTGGIKKAVEFSEKDGVDFAFIVKKRKNDTDVEVSQFVGDVKGKNVLVLDDLTESAGTLISAANCCKNNGAKDVYLAVTHGCLTELGAGRLHEAWGKGTFTRFFCSDSIVEDEIHWMKKTPEYITVVSVADVFGKAILGTHNNNSITELFK